MATTSTAPRDAALPVTPHPGNSTSTALPELAKPSIRRPRSGTAPQTDDEILGIHSGAQEPPGETVGATQSGAVEGKSQAVSGEELAPILDANPDLRAAWDDAQAYRETFATPEEARKATALLADLDRMDTLFFSQRPEDHAELARAVAALDPAAFASLAKEMGRLTASVGARSRDPIRDAQTAHAVPGADEGKAAPVAEQSQPAQASQQDRGLAQAQSEFFHATNAATVQSVLDSIESQVDRLLPEGISKSARNRVVGEIYRELDGTLRSNRQLAQQMREAFRSGSLDGEHQRAIVSLITSRARQALPGVAKRVLNEWTSTLVAADQARRSRQRTAERRVDIAGSSGAGNDGRRAMSPREIDYARMSDADILNL